MTTLPIFGGPIKRNIIDRAYGMCGLSSTEYELAPEEYAVGLRALNDSLPEDCGFNFPTYGDGSPQEESGLANEDVLGASALAARLIAPQIGKQLTLGKAAARAADVFQAKYQTTPVMGNGPHTIAGAGNRWNHRRPFLPASDPNLPIPPIVPTPIKPPPVTPTPTPSAYLMDFRKPANAVYLGAML